jgi:hypothetical protein
MLRTRKKRRNSSGVAKRESEDENGSYPEMNEPLEFLSNSIDEDEEEEKDEEVLVGARTNERDA